MIQDKLKADFKKLVNSPLVGNLSKQWNLYENKVKRIVHDFDLKSREAREVSRERLDRFADQLKRTRGDVERKVGNLLNAEGKRLNGRVSELFNYLKLISKNEKLAKKAGISPRKKSSLKARSGENNPKKRTIRAKRSSGSGVSATTH